MKKSNDLFSFDLMRLTWLGWILLLVSAAVGIGGAIGVGILLESNATRRRFGLPGIIGFFGGVGIFFLLKSLLGLAGVSVIKPPPLEVDDDDDDEPPRRRRRSRRDDVADEDDDDRPRSRRRAYNDEDDDDHDHDRPPRRRRRAEEE